MSKNVSRPPPSMLMMNLNRPRQINTVEVFKPEVSVESITEQPKNKWGAPVWFLFHTLAHKIKPESFLIIKNELLMNIVSICSNLPCPKCAEHATEYMKNVNFDALQNKDDLIKLFFHFHNKVNSEKGYPLFDFELLYDKYDKAITVNIIQNFIVNFVVNDFNVNMINSNFQRNLLLTKLKQWFPQNIQHFDM